jgi:chemotaxis protein MotB
VAKRKKPHVEHPDERWLLTYADMITLLMALFMVMFAMSSVSKTKFQILKVTLHQTFSSAVFDGGSSILDRGAMKSSQTMPNSELTGQDSAQIGEQPVQSPTKPGDKTETGSANTAHQAQLAAAAARRQDADLANAEKTINAAIKKAHLGAFAHIVQDRANGVVIIRLVSDRVLFDLGSYDLKPGAKPLLDSIAHALDKLPNAITVDGYTDAIPAGGQFGNNGLSYFRAQSVLDYMEGAGFDAGDPHHTYPIAHGARDPWKPNGSGGSNPLNRRVEIHILRQTFGTGQTDSASPPLGGAIPSTDIKPNPLG